MRQLFTGIFFCLATFVALADGPVELSITVSGLTPGEGQVFVSVFDEKKDWLKHPVQVIRREVTDEDSLDFTIPGMQTGIYAVSVIYDQDNDGELDTGMFRIPKEPIGTSNNARGKFGPPKWKHTNFHLDRDMHLNIQVADAIQ